MEEIMGRLTGKVAFITGGARGQGRSHALALAAEGADIAVIDICDQIDSVQHSMGTKEDLQETLRLVEKTGQKCLAVKADVRDQHAVDAAVAGALKEFGRIDYAVLNAGIMATTGEPSTWMEAWHDSVATMMSGVYYTLCAVYPSMVERGDGGSIVITSSTSGLQATAYSTDLLTPGKMGYAAAKHGVVGLMRNFAMALGPHRIRVNTIHPMGVNTKMVVNDFFGAVLDSAPPGWCANVFGQSLIEPSDVSNAVVWLCSDDSKYVTGTTLPIDSGQLIM
jgi:SDR family mycofactocin-dependent oxidoreductase